MASATFTYNDSAMREDLLSVVTNLSPKNTQLSSGLGTSVSKAIRHEWLERALSAVKTNAKVEGADATFAVIDPSRLINYCQILQTGYRVTDTDGDVTRATGDRMAEERADAMSVIKNDLELAILQGSLVCGSSTAARQMKGIASWIGAATNVTNQSGISLSETTFVDYMQSVWNLGGEVDEVYVGAILKKRIDGFTAGSTRNVNSEDKRLISAVDVYESSFAPLVKIFLHRYANTNTMTLTGANQNIFGITSKYYRVAYLRKPMTRPLSKTGDAEKEEIIMEATLEDLTGGKAGFWGVDHL